MALAISKTYVTTDKNSNRPCNIFYNTNLNIWLLTGFFKDFFDNLVIDKPTLNSINLNKIE